VPFQYFVYILLCSDNTYYVGVTNNIYRRLEEHTLGKSLKAYTYTRRPVELKYVEVFNDIKQAISREKQIKKWSQKKKLAIIEERYEDLKQYASCLNSSSHLNKE
jgi:putative endonuclease